MMTKRVREDSRRSPIKDDGQTLSLAKRSVGQAMGSSRTD